MNEELIQAEIEVEEAIARLRTAIHRATGFLDKAAGGVIMAVDVQKHALYWTAREWKIAGAQVVSTLLDIGHVFTFEDLVKRVYQFNVQLLGIDIQYRARAEEVGEFCARYTFQSNPRNASMLALMGSDALQVPITFLTVRNVRKAALYCELTWATDVFRTWLVDNIRGAEGAVCQWKNPTELGETPMGAEYLRQVASTNKVDGVWVPPKDGQDHYFDCECMQLVLAHYDNLIGRPQARHAK
jgi:hypothetical protein